MNRLEILEHKVRQAAEQIAKLKADRHKIVAELKFLEEENKKTRHLIKENEALKEQKRSVAQRIERALKKIDTLGV